MIKNLSFKPISLFVWVLCLTHKAPLMAQSQAIDSMTQLWLQYTDHFGGIDENQLTEFSDMLSYRIQNSNTLCSNNTTDLLNLFYEHSQLLVDVQGEVCKSDSTSGLRDSVFVSLIEELPFVADFLTLYLASDLPSKPMESNSTKVHKTSNKTRIHRALSSTWGVSKPDPLRAARKNPSSKWVGDPTHQKYRVSLRSDSFDLMLRVQKKSGETIVGIPWHSFVSGGIQLTPNDSKWALTLGNYRHQSPAKLLSSGSSPPLQGSVTLTTLRPLFISISREPYDTMKGLSVIHSPQNNSQLRLSFSHRALDARTWQGDTLHAPIKSMNWTTQQVFEATRSLTQTSLFFDGSTEIGAHLFTFAWVVHSHSEWVYQRDGFVWSKDPYYGIEAGWQITLPSTRSNTYRQVIYTAFAWHRAPRNHGQNFDGIMTGGYRASSKSVRFHAQAGWASRSWYSPIGGTLTDLSDTAPRFMSRLELHGLINKIRVSVSYLWSQHANVLTEAKKSDLKIHARWTLPKHTTLFVSWTQQSSKHIRWASKWPIQRINVLQHTQKISLTSQSTFGRYIIRIGGRWYAEPFGMDQSSSGWFFRIHSTFKTVTSSLQWSSWNPKGTQTSFAIGQPPLTGASGLLYHTGQSSSLVGNIQITPWLTEWLTTTKSVKFAVRGGIQNLHDRGYKGTGLDSRLGTSHTWIDVHLSIAL